MTCLAATAAGVLVGAVYALIRTAAPAPPPTALLGAFPFFIFGGTWLEQTALSSRPARSSSPMSPRTPPSAAIPPGP